MARKKRTAKKRLKEDRLVTLTVEASQFVQRYFTQVIVGVVILIVAVGASLLTAHVKRTAARNSEAEFALGMSQYNARDVQGAATAFAQIVDKYGNQRAGELSRYFLGKSLLAQSKYEEALGAFDGYLNKAPKDAAFRDAALMGKAACLEGLHNFEAAAEMLEQLSQRLDQNDPRYPEVLFQAGQDYEKTGSKQKALDLYRRTADKATGPLKDRAIVAIALLD
jgi:tetratricopeptide (TPR) repeat protein